MPERSEMAQEFPVRAIRLARCLPSDVPAIREIVNDLIVATTALYEYKPRSLETVRNWFEEKREKGYPIYGAYADDGALLGLSTYGRFREKPAYKYTVEHSVYVRADARRRGIATALLKTLIEDARGNGYHAMVGALDSSNEASARLHERLGFERAGMIRQVGFKFGRWLDLVFYELVLDTPSNPRDD